MTVITEKDGDKGWNAALYSIKRDLQNVNKGLNVDGLNRVWNLFVNSYNRCIRLVEELDRYTTFIPPSSDYYDEIPLGNLTDFVTSSVQVSLTYSKSKAPPKFNNPLLKIDDAVSRFEKQYLSFSRDYVAKGTATGRKSVTTQVSYRGAQVGAVQAYVNLLNAAATQEQKDKANEQLKKAYEEVLVQTATEQAQSLSEVVSATESSKSAVEEELKEESKEPEISSAEIDEIIEKFREAQAAAEAAAKEAAAKAAEAYEEALKALEAAEDAAKEAGERVKEAKTNVEEGIYGIISDSYSYNNGSVSVDLFAGASEPPDRLSFDGTTVTFGSATLEYASYTYDETTGKWINTSDGTEAQAAEASDFDKLREAWNAEQDYAAKEANLEEKRDDVTEKAQEAGVVDNSSEGVKELEGGGSSWTSDDFDASEWEGFW